MIRIVALSLLLVLPASAQEGDTREGINLMEQGARLLFRGLMNDMGPTILQMEQIARILENIDAYHAPEILPNGDVILRRKVPLVPGRDPEAEIEL